ncbi:PilN domain-containing protein [Rahnella selenatireducens]|uniref:PilN domain-containing protein n=1 Tax=Rahnella selenatireducens TaxID=3389797 RepID=UPI003969937F
MLQVNFMPWRTLRRQRLLRYWLRLFVSVPVCVICGVFCLSLFMLQERALLQVHLSALASCVQKLSLQQRRVTSALAEHKVIAEKRAASQQRRQASLNDLQLMVLLSVQIPAEVWLSELTEHQGQLTLKGGGRFYHDILAFSERLSASPLLRDVHLSNVEQQPDHALSFVLTTRFQPKNAVPANEVLPR